MIVLPTKFIPLFLRSFEIVSDNSEVAGTSEASFGLLIS
jgi:hypothetical protein